MEHYLICMKAAGIIANRYNQWAMGPVIQARVGLAFETMSRLLSDKPLEAWDDECATRPAKIEEIFDKNLKRVEAINKMVPSLKLSDQKMTITNINKYVISKNIPRKKEVAYISQGGK
eukprot:5879178-Ditylum_brightwellii.AAC.1